MKTYIASYDCGNDIVEKTFKADTLRNAKVKAQNFKRKHLNDHRIKTEVRLKEEFLVSFHCGDMDEALKKFKKALKQLGIVIKEDVLYKGTDTYGYILYKA